MSVFSTVPLNNTDGVSSGRSGWVGVFFLVYAISTGLVQAGEWRLAKSEDGINVYLRDVAGSGVREFKGIVKIETSLDSLMAVLDDTEACPFWVHQCRDPALIEYLGFSERYTYQVSDLAYPVSDRDMIIHVDVSQDPLTKEMTVKLIAAPDYCDERNSEVCRRIMRTRAVRVTTLNGYYRLMPLEGGWTAVTWQQHTEPGGYIPEWLINMLLVDIPFHTLKQLRDFVNKDKYQQEKLIYGEKNVAIGFEGRRK